MWLTLLWHVGTGLPWAWRNGSSDSSERDHWREMLTELPAAALIVGDAGFIGYDILRAVLCSPGNAMSLLGLWAMAMYAQVESQKQKLDP